MRIIAEKVVGGFRYILHTDIIKGHPYSVTIQDIVKRDTDYSAHFKNLKEAKQWFIKEGK